ncbi:MAG: hypothetical protein H0Z33_01105 [Bacillaceae bacterium]|nr:hypothetical protein [Bacillaceae bacterium]
MLYQIHPVALGRDQSDTELHIWDPDSELDKSFEKIKQIQAECRWGAGLVEDEAALILYLFHKDQTIEVYFPQKVAVGPDREMNSWVVLLSQQPESLVLVYGNKPTDRSKWLRVTFAEKNTLLANLEQFADQTMELSRKGTSDPVIQEVADYFKVVRES